MSEFLKMDVFFFVTTIVVIALGLIVLLIGIKIWSILGHIDRILGIAEKETDLIREDIADLRSEIRRKGFSIFTMRKFISNITNRFTRRSREED